LNIGACQLKLKEYRSALETCQKALELDANNEKGLFRMGQAYQGLAEYQEAINQYQRVIEINAQNRDAQNSISACHQKIKEYNQKEKALYSKMFSTLSK
jgi:tetratricopeptide (TPR) repeat protein